MWSNSWKKHLFRVHSLSSCHRRALLQFRFNGVWVCSFAHVNFTASIKATEYWLVFSLLFYGKFHCFEAGWVCISLSFHLIKKQTSIILCSPLQSNVKLSINNELIFDCMKSVTKALKGAIFPHLIYMRTRFGIDLKWEMNVSKYLTWNASMALVNAWEREKYVWFDVNCRFEKMRIQSAQSHCSFQRFSNSIEQCYFNCRLSAVICVNRN